jgi:hypothetical protein
VRSYREEDDPAVAWKRLVERHARRTANGRRIGVARAIEERRTALREAVAEDYRRWAGERETAEERETL